MDGKYEKTVIKCKKWRSLMKEVVDRNIVVLSKKELDISLLEYGEIVNSSEISNGIDEIDNVWNQSDNEKVPDKNAQNLTKVFSLMIIEG